MNPMKQIPFDCIQHLYKSLCLSAFLENCSKGRSLSHLLSQDRKLIITLQGLYLSHLLICIHYLYKPQCLYVCFINLSLFLDRWRSFMLPFFLLSYFPTSNNSLEDNKVRNPLLIFHFFLFFSPPPPPPSVCFAMLWLWRCFTASFRPAFLLGDSNLIFVKTSFKPQRKFSSSTVICLFINLLINISPNHYFSDLRHDKSSRSKSRHSCPAGEESLTRLA